MSQAKVLITYDETIASIEACLNDGQLQKAEDLCLQALQQYNQDFNLLFYAALTALRENQQEKSLNYGFQAFEALNKPDSNASIEQINNLGIFFGQHKYFKMAIKCFGIALPQSPDNYEVIHNIGCTYGEAGQNDNALKWLLKAEKIKSSSGLLNSIGICFCMKQQIDEGLKYFKKAIELTPDDADAHYNVGRLLQDKGLSQEAEKFLLKAIEINPNKHKAYSLLANVIKFESDNAEHTKIINKLDDFLANHESMEFTDKYKLHYALGKIYKDLKDYDKSFENFIIANKNKALETPYNIDEHKNNLIRNKEIYTAKLVNKKSKNASKATIPVFIVGMPRSGTTLTEQIIACHSKAYGAGETKHIDTIIRNIKPRKIQGNFSTLTPYPEIVPHLSAEEIRSYGNLYLKKIKEDLSGVTKTIDKLPDNFVRIGFIKLIFPNSTIIHCKRHPLDVFTSIFCQEFSQLDYSNDATSLVSFYKLYNAIMKHWHEQFPDKIYDSYYEELVLNQEQKSRELLNKCGLKWEEQCLDFHKLDRPIFTASNLQVKNPMYSDSIFRWKRYEKFLEPVKEALKDEIDEYEAEITKRINIKI